MRPGRVRYNDGYAVAFVFVTGPEIPTLELKPFQDRVFPVLVRSLPVSIVEAYQF